MRRRIGSYNEVIFFNSVDVRGPDECWNWKDCLCNGYGRPKINGELVLAHRYSWSLVNGPIPEGMLILHKCDNRKCVNPAHLYCGTYSNNRQDQGNRNPTSSIAEGLGKAKLSESEILSIRKIWKEENISYARLAKLFNVNYMTISHIVKSTGWLCKEGKYV